MDNLALKGKFPTLPDVSLGLIIGVRESSLSYFSHVREPNHVDEPYVGFCMPGIAVFGRD